MNEKKIIVALDGTVSSGKTSICKSLVKKFKNKAFFFDINLDPNVMIFASLCNLDNFVDFRLKH